MYIILYILWKIAYVECKKLFLFIEKLCTFYIQNYKKKFGIIIYFEYTKLYTFFDKLCTFFEIFCILKI